MDAITEAQLSMPASFKEHGQVLVMDPLRSLLSAFTGCLRTAREAGFTLFSFVPGCSNLMILAGISTFSRDA